MSDARQELEERIARLEAAMDRASDLTPLTFAREVILNLPMPNGKRLRFCTMEECETMGPWFVTLGQRVGKARIPGATLAELVAA